MEITFDQVHVNDVPRMTEADEQYKPVFPHEARLRNLTYATDIYVDAKMRRVKIVMPDKTSGLYTPGQEPVENVEKDYGTKRVMIGSIPVMVRSKFCHIKGMQDNDVIKYAKECTYD